jgi:TusE/DsrC/DsvC family sulfur relay protein
MIGGKGERAMVVRQLKALLHKETAIDDDGYLVNYNEWNGTVAQELAESSGAGTLSKEQIEALKFIRSFYEKYHFFPIVRAVCKHVHRPKECMHEDFPNPLIAWKLAGLPHPEEPIISLLEAGQSPG